MKRKIFFLIILLLLLINYQKISAQLEQVVGVPIICRLANFFANLTLVFCIFAGLKIGYDLMISKGSIEDLSSAKRTMVFVLIGGALSLFYLIFIRDILNFNVC